MPFAQRVTSYGPNRWPANGAALKAAVMAFWQACDQTGQQLLSLIARILGVDPVGFLSLFEYPLSNMTLLHYPPKSTASDNFGIHPHKDTDALTLLFPDPVGGAMASLPQHRHLAGGGRTARHHGREYWRSARALVGRALRFNTA